MELRHIKELMAAMERTRTKRLTLKKDDFEIILEREERGAKSTFYDAGEQEEGAYRYSQVPNKADQALSRGADMPAVRLSPISPEASKEDANSYYITSPMVGTFYNSASPEDAPFVKIGDKVDKHTVVCIIEAMKVMNEIKAGVTGTIAEILIETGHPVEFGTKLFRIIES